MGFQFNQVGGGTKTRRPVALRMQYNPRCSTPLCFLQGELSLSPLSLSLSLSLHQFNSLSPCTSSFLSPSGDDGIERSKTLPEIQAYIESENQRLERDPIRCFDSREINVRMEYKYCPNMILIDTPGLISAPKTPKVRKERG
jgi:hypothetical protein